LSKNDDYRSISRGDLLTKQNRKYDRILVLCIDRDDDIGSKGGIETPVIGRDSCINAGTRLAIEDPEDSDANAIFAAVKTYEDLLKRGYQAEVALVAGKYNRGIEGDEKIGSEIQFIVDVFKADASVIVSDGEDDETVIPVIQSLIPVISIHRVVIRHSRSVEYSYAVFARYVKMLVYDPRYSRFFLGVPGALLVASGIATIFGLTREAIALVLSILGGAFIIRAFDIDKSIGSLGKPNPTSFIRIFSIVAGILIIVVSVVNGLSHIPEGIVTDNMNSYKIITNKEIVGSFIRGTILICVAIGPVSPTSPIFSLSSFSF
jgi:putative membrane protein